MDVIKGLQSSKHVTAARIHGSRVSRPYLARHVRSLHSQKPRRAHEFTIRCNAAPPEVEEQQVDSQPTVTEEKDTIPSSAAEPLGYIERSGTQKALTSFRLWFALPWRRFKNESALVFKLGGAIAEQPQSRFSDTASLPAICDCLTKAAYDPRIKGVVMKIDPLSCGWGKIQEIRRHLKEFRKSGKFTVAYIERAGEKEYYLASAFEEIYIPPSANLSLRGVAVTGSFLRGTLDKIGIDPEVKRIGQYKSAGDQLLRKDMSEAQREQLTALLDDIHDTFVTEVAEERGKTKEEVIEMLNKGIFDMEEFKMGGWVTDLKYEDEINDLMKERTGGKEDELRVVNYKKYSKVGRSAFGLTGGKIIAIVRTSGAIVGGSGSGSNITAGSVIQQLRALKKNKKIAAVVLRVDSPGGDALASDLMWREIRKLAEEKPVIASMADVAASGGYYMSMGAKSIVAEPLTLTGSIGVVTGKFNLAELYEKAGFRKETISRGKYAELLLDTRKFTEEEQALFDAAAQHAYESFRNKAADSRGMQHEAMEEVAQGRVWSGKRAATKGLVDALGGIAKAVAIAKKEAGLEDDARVTLLEVSKAKSSPLALLTSAGGASASGVFNAPLQVLGLLATALMQTVFSGSSATAGATAAQAVGGSALLQALAALTNGVVASSSGDGIVSVGSGGLAPGQVMAEMPDLSVDGVASAALNKVYVPSMTGSELFDC